MGIAANQHLVLVGLMGSGKTTVARVVADRLGRRVIDTDAVIEGSTGRTVREIFVDDGEDCVPVAGDRRRSSTHSPTRFPR